MNQKLEINDAFNKQLELKVKLYENSENSVGGFSKFINWILGLFSGKYDLYTTKRLISNLVQGGYSDGDLIGGIELSQKTLKNMTDNDAKKAEKADAKGSDAKGADAKGADAKSAEAKGADAKSAANSEVQKADAKV